MNSSVHSLLWGSNILCIKLKSTISKINLCFYAVKSFIKCIQTNELISQLFVDQLKTLENVELLYLVRRIYVRFIHQQERQSFSVSIAGSYMRWGKTVLHTKLT